MIVLLCFIMFIFYLVMGIYVMMLSDRSDINRIYFGIIIIFSSWILSAFFRNITDSPGSIFVWRITSYFALTVGTGAIMQFAIALIQWNKFNFVKSLLVYIPGIILFSGQSIITKFTYINTSSNIADLIFGSIGAYLYYLIYILIISVMLYRWGTLSNNRRQIIQGRLIYVSLTITTFSILIYGIILPEVVDFILPFILPLFTSFWVFAMWLSITRYRLLQFRPTLAVDEIMDNVLDIIVLTDHDGRIIDINEQALRLLQYAKEDVLQLNACEFLGLYDDFKEVFSEILHGERRSYNSEAVYYGSNDLQIPVRVRVSGVVDSLSEVIGVVIAAQDLTLETKFKTLSMTDKLTQISNRVRLDEVLDKETGIASDTGNEFCVVICDIDHFKKVNDLFGHQKGDEVLIQFANLLKSNIRDTDLVGRWGGEEFLMILFNCNVNEANEIITKLKQMIKEYDFGMKHSITASFGIAAFENDSSYDRIISRADTALYKAKEKGRDCIEITLK